MSYSTTPEYRAEYRAANRDRINELQRASAARRRAAKGKVKSKASKQATAWDSIKERSKSSPLPALRELVSSAKTRAKYATREFDIDVAYLSYMWLAQDGKCKLSGEPMTTTIGSGSTKVSLDRIDSDKGYTRDNVQLVATAANYLKVNMKQAEFLKWCRKIAEFNG